MNSELMEEIYRDQAFTGKLNFGVSAFYTSTGIQNLDSEFCKRIQAFKRGESYTKYYWSYWSVWSDEPKRPPVQKVERVWTDTKKSLTKDITENPHLHPIIKENLLYNLNS